MIFGQLTSDFPPCSFWTTSGGPMGVCPGFALRVTEWRCSTAEFSVVCWRDVSLFPFPIFLRSERVSIHFLPGFRNHFHPPTTFFWRVFLVFPPSERHGLPGAPPALLLQNAVHSAWRRARQWQGSVQLLREMQELQPRSLKVLEMWGRYYSG